jgi:LCP family protein required for cell wall assembly
MSKDPEEPEYRVYRGGSDKGSTHAGRRKRPRPDAGGGPADFEYGGTGGEPARDERPSRTPPRDPAGPRRAPKSPGSRDARDSRESPDSRDSEPTYRVYRSQPRGLGARLRGETEPEVGRRAEEAEREDGGGRRGGRGGRGGRRRGRAGVAGAGTPRPGGLARWGLGTWSIRRAIKYVVCVIVGWVVLSVVLFMISAETKAGNLPKGLSAALTHTSTPMLVSAQNVLVLGLDNRPTTGYSSKEGGLSASDQIEADARTDSIMLWRVGGGVSRRLSIPRDTLVDVPGIGESKINAAWSQSPADTVKVVEALTGLKINHVVVVDLGNFPKFIDDIGGVTVTTPRICSEISGGVKNGGYTLNLKPGSHHLTGTQALTLARTRENSCNAGYDDIQREKMQQEILNGIKGQLFSVHAFLHLPWASWDAPGVIQTDMGGPTLLQLFVSSEIGGSSKPQTLKETGEVVGGSDVLVPNATDVHAKVNQLLHGGS